MTFSAAIRFDDAGIAIAPLEASAREQAHPAAVTISVVLDLVQPLRAGGRLAGYAGETGLDEAGRPAGPQAPQHCVRGEEAAISRSISSILVRTSSTPRQR